MAPPEGVAIAIAANLENTPRADTDAAARCLEPLATRLALPAVKAKDAWYKLAFAVVAP